MAKYIFVGGSDSMCGGTAMKSFGQAIELTEEQAEEAMRGGCALLPADQFNSIGFTPDELKKYPTAGYQINAPKPFLEKRQAAWSKFGELYAALHQQPEEKQPEPPSIQPPPPVEDQAPVVPVEEMHEEAHS